MLCSHKLEITHQFRKLGFCMCSTKFILVVGVRQTVYDRMKCRARTTSKCSCRVVIVIFISSVSSSSRTGGTIICLFKQNDTKLFMSKYSERNTWQTSIRLISLRFLVDFLHKPADMFELVLSKLGLDLF